MSRSASKASDAPGFGRVGTELTLGFGVAFMILVLLGWLSLQSAAEVRDNTREVSRTVELLGTIDAILGGVTDAETSSRGFVITGGATFLEPYDAARRALPGALAQLHRLLPQDDRLLLSYAGRLDTLVAEKLQFIALVTRTRRERGLRPAAALVQTGRGKETMDSIRHAVADIEIRQRWRLGLGLASLEATEQRLKDLIMLGTAAAGLVALLSLVAVRRELVARQGADLALRHSEQALKRSEEQLLRWVVDRGEPPRQQG
jgi:CHASE3 domain sensor protein